jgi:hypothetical protein
MPLKHGCARVHLRRPARLRARRLDLDRPGRRFVIALFAVKEGREAWEGELACDHD